MREIKFRAWDEINKCMVNVSTLHLGKKIMIEHDKSDWDWYQKQVPLMQFTGLKDKNGREIYEGDIIDGWVDSHWHSGKDRVHKVVEWQKEYARFNLDSDTSDVEVIGNIYENPELSKG